MSDTIASIVERFAMNIEGPPPGRDAWFLDYVLRSPKEAGRHLTAGWLALNSVKEVYREADIQTCVEYFGGMGAQALMVQHLFNIRSHTVMDYSEDAVRHMRNIPCADAIRQADSYDPVNTKAADLVMLDFGDLTVWKTREGEQHRGLLDRVFELEPKAVVLTDIACRYLHLHRERYETLLGPGTCGSYETYLDALFGRLAALYGYEPHVAYWDRWSTVVSLVPMETSPRLIPTPDSPVGLELF